MTKRAAIILAGGQAKRFQVKPEQWEDKALAVLFGKPLLVHIIERTSDAVDEIVVCANDEARKTQFSEVLREYSIRNVKICTDEKTQCATGPLIAIATGLKFTNADYCLTLPCDVPLIQPKIVDYLFNIVRGSNIAVPTWPDGGIEPLMMVCERQVTVQIADALCELRRRRPDDVIRGASKVLFVSTVGDLRKLDPEFKSFVNINLREDLARLPARVVKKGPFRENLRLNIGSPRESELKQLRTAAKHRDNGNFQEAYNRFSSSSTRLEREGLNFWAGVSRENEGTVLFNLLRKQENTELKKDDYIRGKTAFAKAARNFELEAETYDKNHISLLAKHAKTDQSWCQQRADRAQL